MPEDISSGGFTITLPGTSEDVSSGGFTIILPSSEVSQEYTSTNAWLIMYNLLQTGTYELSTDNILSAWNDVLIEDIGLPIVIIYPPLMSTDLRSINGTLLIHNTNFTIEIYHKTSRDCKALKDEVVTKIINGYSVLAAEGLKRSKDEWFNTADYDAWLTGENHRVHRYTIEVNFRWFE
jgi:hypothetical protein